MNVEIEKIKEFFKLNHIYFASNTRNPRVGSLFEKSYNLYSPLIDEETDNFILINGSDYNYGYKCFLEMIEYALYGKKYPRIDYIVYIDEDCFISDLKSLKNIVEDFISSDRTFAGMPDGGVCCHRNHNNVAINTFFTIFNIRQIRDLFKGIEQDQFKKHIVPAIESYSFERFSKECPYNKMNELFNDTKVCAKHSTFIKNFYGEPEYCNIVRNDPNNPIEPHQEPYSSKLDNFEPYYKLFFYLMKLGAKPYYIVGADAWKDNEKNVIDNMGGICTALFYNYVPFCYHTWFARCYVPEADIEHVKTLPNSELFLKHTDRINQVYNWVVKHQRKL